MTLSKQSTQLYFGNASPIEWLKVWGEWLMNADIHETLRAPAICELWDMRDKIKNY
jgi:hypothetical protein